MKKRARVWRRNGNKNEIIEGVQVRENTPELSFVIWREKCYCTIKYQLLHAVLDIIHKDRTGLLIDMTLVRSLLQTYESSALGVDDKTFYQREFEEPFLEVTKSFYTTESTQYIYENGVSEYMRKAEARIEQEQSNAKNYYLASTEPRLRAALNEVLIQKHMEALQTSFSAMIKDEKI